jgi:hypothetical protein
MKLFLIHVSLASQIEVFTIKLIFISKFVGFIFFQDYSAATVVFLYLVPRGLKLILPILLSIPRKLRVVTYMSPFPNIPAKECVKVGTRKHTESQWPLFLYELNTQHP